MFHYDPKTDGKEAKDLFDKLYKDIKFDKNHYRKLKEFRIGWTRKGVEYSEFLGGNLLGVHPIRFSTRDDEALLTGIYNTDPQVVYTNILKLPDIQKSWKVATNPVLQTMTYTMHRFIVDNKLGRDLEDGLKECYYIFAYKVLGSLISHYFKYNTSPAIAKAVYEKLSNRYLIKKLGTWNKVLENRAKDVIPPDGLHVERLKRYTTEDSVRVVNDLQGRLRETIKNIYLIMIDVIENNSKIESLSMIEENQESEEVTKDITDRPDIYINRLHESVGSEMSLIDLELVHLVSQLINGSDPELIKETLITLSEHYNPNSKEAKYLDYIIIKTIEYCRGKGIFTDYKKNILTVIDLMRGYWTSGTVKDKEVIVTKKYIEKLVKQSTRRKTKWYIASNTLAVIVYLFIRAVK